MAAVRIILSSSLTLWTALAGLADRALATGGFDDEPPPSLPYFLDRLPAKPPARIFQETFPGAATAPKPVDFKTELNALARDTAAGKTPAALLGRIDELLAAARLDPVQPGPLCNLLNDFHDLFASTPPAPAPLAAEYIRWRLENAGAFRVRWDGRRPAEGSDDEEEAARFKKAAELVSAWAARHAHDPLYVHCLYLRGAIDFPRGGKEAFQQVIHSYPEHPRAEAARFMLARCKFAASRTHRKAWEEPTPAETALAEKERGEATTLFAAYLKQYPKGRFAADVPGWLGAIAFDDGNYSQALDHYLEQAEMPGHPEVLKSSGFMCERCLSRLSADGDKAPLEKIAAHPRLAMGLIYLVLNTPESNSRDDKEDEPAQVKRWRKALLPRLAAAVASKKELYAAAEWQPRYLAILAQAASGAGDQEQALTLCDSAPADSVQSDDLAFARLVVLSRARKLPEAIAAGREFEKHFPKSALAPGAALRLAFALQDAHQAGAAVATLLHLRQAREQAEKAATDAGEDDLYMDDPMDAIYPSADQNLSIDRSVLQRDASGTEMDELIQVIDTLLNFAPLPELAAAVAPNRKPDEPALAPADELNVRAVLVQRWLAEEENFNEARKYASPAQWGLAAGRLQKLADTANAAAEGEPRAAAYKALGEGWAAARGKLLFAPLETDETRHRIFLGDDKSAGLRRRENGLSLGMPAKAIEQALSERDERQHAFTWWLKAADAAPPDSALRAQALWSALRAMPSLVRVSPYLLLHAAESDATGQARGIYDRLRRECPDSRETREWAVYYDLAPPRGKANASAENQTAQEKAKAVEPNLGAALNGEALPHGEPEYRWNRVDEDGEFVGNSGSQESGGDDKKFAGLLEEALALRGAAASGVGSERLAQRIEALRKGVRSVRPGLGQLFLVNFADDLAEFFKEPAAKLTPAAIKRYVELRTECLSVEHWGHDGSELPPVPDAGEGTLNDTVLAHVRSAYHAPEMAPFKDYLDFLAMAVVANANIDVTVPGQTQEAKDGPPGKREPVTYVSRDYAKLAKLAEGFLKDYPHSRKREAARFLYARALYAASRPRPQERMAAWPESGHFASEIVVVTYRQQPFDPRKIGAALNAYDHEFTKGRYANDVRNLRGLLAWRTQDWPLAIKLTLQTLADDGAPDLQQDAETRLLNIFVDGLTDESERRKCLEAIKSDPTAVAKLREILPNSPYPLFTMRSWVAAQL